MDWKELIKEFDGMEILTQWLGKMYTNRPV